MKPLDLSLVYDYVNEHIDSFHQGRIASIERLSLRKLLSSKNMYLFKAKNVNKAQDLVEDLLNAHISSSEEELFG